jgi:hypothetical protein
MVMVLPPAPVSLPKPAAAPNREIQHDRIIQVTPAFATYGEKGFTDLMNRILLQFESDNIGATEKLAVDSTDARPAILSTTQWTVHRYIVAVAPIELHELEIATIEGPVIVRERAERLGWINVRFLTGDWCGGRGSIYEAHSPTATLHRRQDLPASAIDVLSAPFAVTNKNTSVSDIKARRNCAVLIRLASYSRCTWRSCQLMPSFEYSCFRAEAAKV